VGLNTSATDTALALIRQQVVAKFKEMYTDMKGQIKYKAV
jgi:hypothetical protein